MPRNSTLTAKKAGLPTFPEVDLENRAEVVAFNRELLKKAGKRIRADVKKLQAIGIIDASGKRLRKELPPDMRPGSRCRLPG